MTHRALLLAAGMGVTVDNPSEHCIGPTGVPPYI
jgi:hypothetical protein